MNGRIRSASNQVRLPLTAGWELCAQPANADASLLKPLPPNESAWTALGELATVADALRAQRKWSLDSPPRRFDADDWWYRLRFDVAADMAGHHTDLLFDGLATLCEAWLNGVLLLTSDNMHLSHEIQDAALRAGPNELLIRFASLDAWLALRRSRPRWRVPMVEHQQLRWARTTLLGRTPGWSPPAAPVGPWRGVWLRHRRALDVSQVRITPRVVGDCGVVELHCLLSSHRPIHRFIAQPSNSNALAACTRVRSLQAAHRTCSRHRSLSNKCNSGGRTRMAALLCTAPASE